MSKSTSVQGKVITAVCALLLVSSCEDSRPVKDQSIRGELIVFNAGALTVPIADLLREFARRHPRLVPQQESSGSLDAVRKITELGKPCDILAVADYEIIPSLLMPQFADWYSIFARNQMVLMFTPKSKFAGEINSNNWFEILLRPGVQPGHSDPNTDPAGYRTMLHWQLTEKHYHRPGLYQELKSKVPLKNIRPKSVELIALLQSGELDYIYGYRSVAEQNKLQFITFPSEIDLSDIHKAKYYKTVSVEVAGNSPGEKLRLQGTPILFGLTVPKSAPHKEVANNFVEFMFSADGQAIMKQNHLMLILPALVSNPEKLAARLQDKFVPMNGSVRESLETK